MFVFQGNYSINSYGGENKIPTVVFHLGRYYFDVQLKKDSVTVLSWKVFFEVVFEEL
jgi:hypothetical protein